MKILKKVVNIGNGAAVYVPKEYQGREIVVVLPEGIESIRKRVLQNLIEFMPNILGVYLYGSYAREEQGIGSDIDILVITKEKDKKIKSTLKEIDVRIMTLENIKKSIKNLPALMMPILKEAKPFLNSLLIDELKEEKIDFRKFKWNFEDIKRIINIIEKFIEIDPKNISPSHVYSLIMRIRVCYMIETLLSDKRFSNKEIEEVLKQYGLSKDKIYKFYDIYRKIREDKEPKVKISKEEILSLIKIVRDYSKRLENETKKKIKKRG